jgi:hypothetical protein
MRRWQNYEIFSLIKTVVITHLGLANLTTDDNLLTAYTFVMYRSLYPDQATVNEMKKALKENGIDFDELVEYRMENCKFGDWSAEEDTGVGK